MAFNATLGEPWSGYISQAHTHISSSPRLMMLGFAGIPVLAIVLNVLYQFLPRDRSLPPMVFHWLPWFGSAAGYGQDPVAFFTQCREKYGDVFSFMLLGTRVTVALGMKGNDVILGGKHTVLAAEDIYAHLTTPVFGKDVVYDCPNELLMEQKKFVKVSLTTENLRSYVGMITDEVTQFMNNDPAFRIWQMNDINEWGAFPILTTLAEMTILTAARTLQGKEIRANMTKGFADLYCDLDHGFTPLHWMLPGLPLPSYWKRDAAHAKMSKFYQDIIAKRRAGEEADEDDVVSSLMQQKYRNGRPLKDHEIAHIMIALLMAGQHTSSSSLAWTLLHLADDTVVAEELYQEQVEHFGNPDGSFRDLTYEDMRKLPKLDAVIRETLRMHPPIHSIMRKVRSDLPLPPTLAAPSEDSVYVVPKGDIMLASPLISQIDPLMWTDAQTWTPARWLDKDGSAAQAQRRYDEGAKVDFGFGLVSKGTESPYLPFGAGRHRCIGEQFAHLQVGVVLATMIRKVELRLEGPFPAPNYACMMVQPFPTNVIYRRRAFD
ncbi:cytochrome P450 [Amylocystis lapponica]|nr:cytochrome P450 [Amylocystis lapponica]